MIVFTEENNINEDFADYICGRVEYSQGEKRFLLKEKDYYKLREKYDLYENEEDFFEKVKMNGRTIIGIKKG
jgi:hypothetical protein